MGVASVGEAATGASGMAGAGDCAPEESGAGAIRALLMPAVGTGVAGTASGVGQAVVPTANDVGRALSSVLAGETSIALLRCSRGGRRGRCMQSSGS